MWRVSKAQICALKSFENDDSSYHECIAPMPIKFLASASGVQYVGTI